VAIDATPLLGNPTGVGVFCAGALPALAARPELELHAFSVSWRGRTALSGLLPEVGARQRPMPASVLHRLWRYADGPPLEWFTGAVDVVHGTNFVVPPTRRAASVVTVHDLTPLRFPELANRTSLRYPALLRRALRRGSWVHAVSEFVADEVRQEFDVDPDRVRVVAHGVPPLPDVDDEAARDIVRRVLPEGASSYVLAVGTAEPRKDLPGLVQAFDALAKEHRELALVLAGPPGWGEQAVADAVARAAARARIVRAGWVDQRVLSALLHSAAVLAYPSRYEGFGFPPLQAMAAGVPVVATRTGAVSEIVGDGALLVSPGQPEELADGLDKVLCQADLRQALTSAGRARAAHFSWSACGEGLARLYGEAAAARGG
jgi:glycosyltransferase involved in cell wall biosynthesis